MDLSNLHSISSRPKHPLLRRPPVLIAAVVSCAGLLGCGGASDNDDLQSNLVGILMAEDDLPREQATCMADSLLSAGFNAEDLAAVDAYEDGPGAKVSSRIYDMTIDAATACVPGFVPNTPTFG